MPPPSSKNREDGLILQRQLPAPVPMSSINFAHGAAASEWPALYDQWDTTSQDNKFWLARFKEAAPRKLSLEMPLPLLKLDAFVVSRLLNTEHSQQIVDSKLVVPLVVAIRLLCERKEAFAPTHGVLVELGRSLIVDTAMGEIVSYAEQLAANDDPWMLYEVVRLPASNRKSFKAALLASSVPSSLESYWERNKDNRHISFWFVLNTICPDSPNPRWFVSILCEALEIDWQHMHSLRTITFSAIPCGDELLLKIIDTSEERLRRDQSAPLAWYVVSCLAEVLSKHFDTIQLLDRDFIPTVIPLIVPWMDRPHELKAILQLWIAIAERATPILLHQLLASGVLAELSKLLQDTNCDEEVRELAVRCQQLLLQTPIEHDKPNRPEDRTVGFSLQQQQHDFIL